MWNQEVKASLIIGVIDHSIELDDIELFHEVRDRDPLDLVNELKYHANTEDQDWRTIDVLSPISRPFASASLENRK